MSRKLCVVFVACLCALLNLSVQACTTFVIGKKATADGSVMCTHTNDGSGTTDPRFVRIPAQDFPVDSLRPIWASPESYPRYVGYDRNASEYFPENCKASASQCAAFQPIGHIPQVPHTFAYFETTYGVMNERQVGIGESTCSGVFVARAIDAGGKALLSVDQLSQIGMERANTAREAVSIMGALAEEYGFYGESTSFEGGSESLLVIDPNEGWVFHILADPTGTSAIWVAARVPDDSVAVVANMFSVREVNLTDTDNFLGSANMWEIAEAQGLWSPGQAQDFTATFSDGEYAHKYYSGRRMWGVFDMLAPSQNLPSEYDNLKFSKPYPFAVKVDAPVSVEKGLSVLRSWYEGTNYSTSSGLSGGAFGTPDRFSSNAEDYTVSGNWERTIALFRTSDSFLVQARGWLPDNVGGVIWLGPHAAHYTTYVPITISVLTSPPTLSAPYQGSYDASTLFWQSRNIGSLAQGKFAFMIEDIRTHQQTLESESLQLLNLVSEKVFALANAQKTDRGTHSSDIDIHAFADTEITSILTKNVNKVHAAYVQLFEALLFKYADGYINSLVGDHFSSTAAGYPVWWLNAVGYADGPEPIGSDHSKHKAAKDKSQDKLAKCLHACLDGQSKSLKVCSLGCL